MSDSTITNVNGRKAKLIIVMGVSGTGKSCLAENLADQLNHEFVEADDFHTTEAKQLMSAGSSITDHMRQDWVNRLCRHLTHLSKQGKSVVLAYSGLKAKHRMQFRHLNFDACFLWLSGDSQLIAKRMSERQNHFVKASFLEQQLKDMEYPTDKESDIHTINIDGDLTSVYTQAIDKLKQSNKSSIKECSKNEV